MITLTPVAIEKVKLILAGQEEAKGLRIAVTGTGCSGFQYQMKLEKESGTKDEIYEMDGLKLFIDKHSLLLLSGTHIDFVENENGSGFKFDNPNASSACGCGDSFEA